MELGVMELGMALVGAGVAAGVALIVMRLIRRTVTGCVSAGVGCMVLAIGLLVIGAFLAAEADITRLQDLTDLLPRP